MRYVSNETLPHETFPVVAVEYVFEYGVLEQYAVVRLDDGSTRRWWVGGYGWVEYADTGELVR